VWWCTSIIPTFGQLSQEDDEFKASLSYLAKKEKKSGGKKKKKLQKKKTIVDVSQ
jgi:hypothetical protein